MFGLKWTIFFHHLLLMDVNHVSSVRLPVKLSIFLRLETFQDLRRPKIE